MDKPYKDTASYDEQNIIKGFFSGKSVKTLAKEYAASHTSLENHNRQMTIKEAMPIIHNALLKISWGGVTLLAKKIFITLLRKFKPKRSCKNCKRFVACNKELNGALNDTINDMGEECEAYE